jgi:hypothetical protein
MSRIRQFEEGDAVGQVYNRIGVSGKYMVT